MSSNIRKNSDLASFKKELAESKRVVALTGAGVSAESGVPTFRGSGGFWRKLSSTDLATPKAFSKNPSLVWEFYHYRREIILSKNPNPAHEALMNLERRLDKEGKNMVIITQNIDGLHKRAGSKNIIELHGNLFRVRCIKCGESTENRDHPICEALRNKGSPDFQVSEEQIPEDQLPRCQSCGGLLRPDVVWFGESLNRQVINKAQTFLDECDFCLVVGTSSVVYPAAMFAPEVAGRGVTVAEFNVTPSPFSSHFTYYFEGQCGKTLPSALSY